MTRQRRCATCGSATNPNGTPTVVVAVKNGEDVYACAAHSSSLAGRRDDPLVAIAQYQDMARRRFRR
jgi:NADH pyrophosphatase NudC (nudix superfamily)